MARDDPENYACGNEILRQQKPNSVLTALVPDRSKRKRKKGALVLQEKRKAEQIILASDSLLAEV